jgi:hypothetical protein
MGTSSIPRRSQPELAPGTVEVLQAATRVLAGVALRSLDVLDGTVTLSQFRMLAVLADLRRARSVQVARPGGSRSWRGSWVSSRPLAGCR